MNVVNIIGNLTKDVELKSTTSGVEVCTFTLGVRRNYTNKEGKYDSDFPNFIAYKKTAEIISKYAKKGSKLAVEGRIQTRSYEKDGKKVYVTEIVVENVTLLDSKKESTTNLPEQPKQEEEKLDPYTAFGDSIEVAEEQQELPFDESSLPF
jgi:single-strand DNA-binding protein